MVNCRVRSGDSIQRCYEHLGAALAAAAMGRLFAAFAHGSGHLLPWKLTCVRCGFLHRFTVAVTSVSEKRPATDHLTCAFVTNRVAIGWRSGAGRKALTGGASSTDPQLAVISSLLLNAHSLKDGNRFVGDRREDSASSDGVSWSVAIPNATVAADESPFSAGLYRARFLHYLAWHEGACGRFIASSTTAVDEGRYCFELNHVVCLVGRGAPTVPSECYSDYVGARTSGLAECGTVWGNLA